MTDKGVSIIILTWNGLSYTKKCLDSFFEHTHHADWELIIVDNGSTDGTIEYLKGLPGIKLICNDTNLGFVRGNNQAIKLAKPENDILFLNNDMIIEQDNWLNCLQETCYSAEDIGIVGPRLKGIKGELQHVGTYIYPETCWGQQIGGNEADINQYSSFRDEVQGVIFACAYVKRCVIDLLQGLDESFFSYFEDTDFCLSAKEKGYRTFVDGRITLIHFHNTSTKINNVDFGAMFKKSQLIFKKKWADKLKKRYTSGIGWHSIVNLPSGYGVSSKNLMLAMDQLDIDVRYNYVYGAGTPFPVEEPKSSDDYRINVIRDRTFNTQFPQVVYGQGDVFYKNTGKYKIGFTMLEVDKIPSEWAKQSNMMDEVWVPSAFNKETFLNSGVKVPIHVIPLGVDPNYFHPDIKSYKLKDKFVFLSVFEWGERKAPEKLLKAFADEFRNNDDVVLLCKVFNHDGSVDVRAELQKLGIGQDHSSIILLYNQNIPGYQMGTLYRSADCFVLPTRGEGWGMPILEAMACGTPVIATDWSAQTDFFNTTYGYPIRVAGLIPAKAKCPYYQGFNWSDPDEEHLRHLMRHVYEHRAEAKQKGLQAAEYVRENWTWKHAALKIQQRLAEIQKNIK